MSQPKYQKHSLKPTQHNTDLMIADVPVVISIVHGEETLEEYEDVIDLEFTPHTPEGRTNFRRFHLLKDAKRLSTLDFGHSGIDLPTDPARTGTHRPE
ncbi:MAG: hypothetical protein M3361_08270, partial [Candidatus Tectomicrobia bacterium]|nr:hypothetical protein [Candidatus Tectomicrobia bacterium]